MAFVDERIFKGSTDSLFELFDLSVGKKALKSENVILLLKKFLHESIFLEKNYKAS